MPYDRYGRWVTPGIATGDIGVFPPVGGPGAGPHPGLPGAGPGVGAGPAIPGGGAGQVVAFGGQMVAFGGQIDNPIYNPALSQQNSAHTDTDSIELYTTRRVSGIRDNINQLISAIFWGARAMNNLVSMKDKEQQLEKWLSIIGLLGKPPQEILAYLASHERLFSDLYLNYGSSEKICNID
jgi:hypothetical protein